MKPKSFQSRQNSISPFFLFTGVGSATCLRVCMDAMLLPQSYYPNLPEGADSVSGQPHGDEKCPFSGVSKCGSLEEGGGKRCSQCGSVYDLQPHTHQTVKPHSEACRQ